jgi:hypothetical protein
MIKFLLLIKQIDPEIMKYVFKGYIEQCKHIHVLAFFQWRLHFYPERKFQNDESDEEIRGMINLKID